VANPTKAQRTHRRRVLVTALILIGALLIASSAELHGAVQGAVRWASGMIRDHPFLGTALFVVLAAISAMLAFFSSVILIPVAVDQWGPLTTVVLLWMGWTLGGLAAYSVGRYWGAGVVRFFVSRATMDRYESQVNANAPFHVILLVQGALPSEIPGYLLGIARYPLLPYLAALSIAQLPYSIGAVILGNGFLHRQFGLMIVIGTLGLIITGLAAIGLKRFLAPA
jgi:uncharacterized membrane protein YdjX (TVP38/TMEM64 family)